MHNVSLAPLAAAICNGKVLTRSKANVRNGAAFRCVEAVGQAVSYGLNTNANLSTLVGL